MDEERLKALRALGVKTATFLDGQMTSVEFYPTIAALDFDTLVPPPPADASDEKLVKTPPALARLLQRKSVS